MRFPKFFTKDEVSGARVLVCGLNNRFDELVKIDSCVYKRFYPATGIALYDRAPELISALRQGYDIVHLFCDVLPNGMLADSSDGTVAGTTLLQRCCDLNVKLLWIASGNQPDLYLKSFNARGKRINLVMTLDRNGFRFSDFLDRLLFKMVNGDTMPVAWEKLHPQIPGYINPDAPSNIFFAGRGGVKLR